MQLSVLWHPPHHHVFEMCQCSLWQCLAKPSRSGAATRVGDKAPIPGAETEIYNPHNHPVKMEYQAANTPIALRIFHTHQSTGQESQSQQIYIVRSTHLQWRHPFPTGIRPRSSKLTTSSPVLAGPLPKVASAIIASPKRTESLLPI